VEKGDKGQKRTFRKPGHVNNRRRKSANEGTPTKKKELKIWKFQEKKREQRLYSTKIEEFPFSGYPLDNASPTTLAIHQCLHPAF
jgi:hypothetical protein